MACNCGGRSGGRVPARSPAILYRHTDPHGGKVDYADEQQALAAQRTRGGTVEKVDGRTGATLQS